MCVCVYSNSRNDGFPSGSAVRNHCSTHPEPCARPRCVYSVLRAHVQFCRIDKRTPPPTFSDTAITDRHSDTTIFQLSASWVQISRMDRKNRADMCPGGSRTLDLLRDRRAPYPLGRALRLKNDTDYCCVPILLTTPPPPNLSGTYP